MKATEMITAEMKRRTDLVKWFIYYFQQICKFSTSRLKLYY